MPIDIRQFADSAALASAAARDWLNWLNQAQQRPGNAPICVALSGGRITRDFFQETVRQFQSNPAQPSAAQGLFKNVHFFWADERCVPPTDPESNYALARKLLFEPLAIPAAQIHRLRGETDEPRALAEAVSEITNLSQKVDGPPVFDLIFLGMGEDGHTASLFPGESNDAISNPAVYRAVTAVKPPPRRVTLGYGALLAAREIWALVSGNGKEAAFRQSLSSQSTPFGRILQRRSSSTVYTDIK